jgi:hypothetical protein
MTRVIAVVVFAFAAVMSLPAGEIGFIEDFALAKDREAALKKLIPGTEDYYYFHCLHFLNTEQYDKVEPMTRPWHQRHGQTPRLTEIQTRYALLTHGGDPAKSLAYLRDKLGLRFDHQKEIVGGTPNLPTSLDQKLISRAALRAIAFANRQHLDGFEDAALDWLASENHDWERRRNLLQRLQRPDVPKLPQLVNADLRSQNPQPFGSFAIHRQMTLAQLDELVKLMPELLNQTAYIHAYIARLHPTADEDWRRDPERTRAYLDRLLAFTRRLAPVNNPLKAHVLHHRLVLDRSLGNFDKALFQEYTSLPRGQGYMSKRALESEAARRWPADLNADFSSVTLLPAVGNDEPLVRSYLRHFFLAAENSRQYEDQINDVYLRHLLAETKIEAGLGDPEDWASQLPPEQFKALKERIDIDFAFTNKSTFAADEPVKLDLFVKGVPTLLVKVFEVNTANYYRTHQREVDTDISLDGLVANSEQTYTYTDPPLRRVGRHYEFPGLNKPGVYVIDFIGAGKSSRALVRKGRLRTLVAASTAGQKIAVVDDNDKPVTDATLWLGGQEYHAAKDGTILIPFSTSPGMRPVVLSRGDFACLDHIQHQPEAYHLAAGIHVDRESLLTQRLATVLVRPGLYLNGLPVSVNLLEEVRLRLTAVDQDGIANSTEVPNFKLFEDRESTYEFRVPPRLASLNVTLLAKVKSLTQAKQIDVSAGNAIALNSIATTDKIEDLHLARFGNDYALELLGRSGEMRADRPVMVTLKHRDFRDVVPATLKTDERGRVILGALADILSVTATSPEGVSHTWGLPGDQHTYRRLIHAKAGELLSVPYVGTAPEASRDELALFELREGNIQTDRFEALAVRDAMVEIRGLAAGDYQLVLKRTGEQVHIRVVDGPEVAGNVLGKVRHLETAALKPVHIAAIESDADTVSIRLRDSSPFARVHVFAMRYQPESWSFANLARVRDAELRGVLPAHAECAYLTGRNIGDEYRYVLDRRLHKIWPGNMLERPALLLNPWAVRSTQTSEQMAQLGDNYAAKGVPPPMSPAPDARPMSPEGAMAQGGGNAANLTASLDFLDDASAVLTNLVPDKTGVVRIARKDLGPHALIHVVAVDPVGTSYRSVALAEQPAKFADLRLRQGLDPQSHFTQQKQVTVLKQGQPFTLADAAGSRFEVYDSLAKVYGLYSTLSKDANLAEFAFILHWPTLKPEEKRTLYSKYACHELNFFLAKKDAEFFGTVVQPYLRNKKDKTFVDHWLLGDDLSEFTRPWQFGRLNTAERVLLAQRLAGEPSRTARMLDELQRLQPPNADRLLVLFETAVKGSAMEAGDALGLERFKGEAERKMLKESVAGEAPMVAAPPGAAGMGGFGAGGGRGPGGPAGGGTPMDAPANATRDFAKRRSGVMREEAKKDGKEQFSLDALNSTDKLGAAFRADDRALAGIKAPQQLYRNVDVTMEWAEDNYFHLPIAAQVAALVPIDPFWLDYARHDGRGPFLSENLAGASRNFTEIMFALAVLDLPFTAGKHDVKFEGDKMTFTPAGPAVAFHEQVSAAQKPAKPMASVMVSENFYRNGDRYRDENGERFDKFVTDEFVIHTVYGGQVVVTNPSPSRQKLSVLIQVPVGAIPVANGQKTRTVLLDLEPYRTQTIDYLFYFPRPGKFAHFPVHVAKAEALVASAQPFAFNVVAKPTKLDTESWAYISQHGTNAQVLAFLERENVHALNLDLIAFRMRDRDFFTSALRLLRERHAYSPTLWSYGIHHNDVDAAREFLTHADNIVAECGGPIVSPLLVIDPVARHQFEHLEYKPLVNARAHSLGKRRQIVNDRFFQQYEAEMKLLSYRKQLSDDDLLAVTYYLILQDRIEEALATFSHVNPTRIATQIQYDYCSAYLDLFGDEPRKARPIAQKYLNHPVDRWRNAFVALNGQLDEIEGKPGLIADADDRSQRQGAAAANEPDVQFVVDGKNLKMSWQNIDSVRLNYYLMDVELLFSRNPFVQQSGGQFASIRPNFTQDMKLPPKQKQVEFRLPEELAKRNVLVEVSAGGKTRSAPYYASAMDVKLTENYGQLRVTDSQSGKALPKVYVKCYARHADGTVKFYKDGYTDLRGRFDYASVSTPEKSPVERFAVLVLSDEYGALIREAAPPQR